VRAISTESPPAIPWPLRAAEVVPKRAYLVRLEGIIYYQNRIVKQKLDASTGVLDYCRKEQHNTVLGHADLLSETVLGDLTAATSLSETFELWPT
jgi:hypothetical protein